MTFGLFRHLPRLGRKSRCLAGRRFVIDGTNVLLLHGRRKPDLRYLLTICEFIAANGGSFECVFDANTAYLLRDYRPTQLALYSWLLCQSAPGTCFDTVPGGTQADDRILERAREQGADVISNDRFRDRAQRHRWIWKRRHGIRHANDRLLLESLDASLSVAGAGERYLRRWQRGRLTRLLASLRRAR